MKRLHRLALMVIVIFGLASPLISDSTDSSMSRNALTLEGLGPGIFYSVNYENSFNRYSFLRVGFFLHSALGFPILYNLRFGNTTHQLITGIGVVPYFESTLQGWKAKAFFAANLGYRWILGESIFLQIAFTPLMFPCGTLGTNDPSCVNGFVPFGGLTIGYLF